MRSTTKATIAFLMTIASQMAFAADSFDGAVPEPMGRVKESLTQLRVRFPEEIVKDAKTETFRVACLPAAEGFSGWADSNTMWTFDFKEKEDGYSPRLAGGTKCVVEQVADIKASSGKTWKAGTIKYDVVIGGPNVEEVIPAYGFNGSLRETEPVVLIKFDGPVDRTKFFAEQNGFLNYMSANAPSEKISLAQIPEDQEEKLFDYFKKREYSDLKKNGRNWILATVKQNLIPGSQLKLTVENQTSADNADVRADVKFVKEYSVRSNFQAEIRCANPNGKTGSCLPNSEIGVALNGMVKWADVKDAYIEYIPYDSKDKKTVRSFAEIEKERKIGFWDSVIHMLAYYFPYLAKYSDTVLDSFVFNVNIEPQTQAKVVLPQDLTDLDGRKLSNVLREFHIRIGSMREVMTIANDMSFFERAVENAFLPVGIVNLNQKIIVRKSGKDAKVWEPIRDFPTMIKAVRAYAARGEYRETPDYTSPLEQVVPSNTVEQKLTGAKNRPTVLQFPFGTQTSGMYPIEISSPTLEKARSSDKSFYNPVYSLAQLTDLTVHLKKGKDKTVAWVTRLSNAQPVGGAQLEVYNCVGEKLETLTTDGSGLASFANRQWAKDCDKSEESEWSQYLSTDEYFVGVKSGDDFALIHSSWNSKNGYAFSAPGIEWFMSTIRENEPNYHAIIGVNLVKPGQQVPVELVAKVPDATGFSEVAPEKLAKTARVYSSDDEDLYYEFPLTWTNGRASFTWQVPPDSAARLGQYMISVNVGGEALTVQSGDIEVAEFKIPLMTGLIAFPKDELVRPDTVPVSSIIRYANGVGSKNLSVDVSYFFTPTSLENKALETFAFGTGPVEQADTVKDPNASQLPSQSRPAVLQGLKTGEDGSLVKDIAKEQALDGRTIAEVLKDVQRPQKLIVRVRYQDQVGEFQTLSQAKNVYNSRLYVGTQVVGGTRAAAKMQAAVVDVAGQNVTSVEDLDIKIVRIETRVVGEELFGGLIKNTLEREYKAVRWPKQCSLQNKIVSCAVGALKEGSYAYEVTSKSAQQTAHTLFKVATDGRVYGPNEYYNQGDDEGSRQLPLALNKPTYKSGETAVVSFAPPFKACRALVTLERSDVIKAVVVENACEKGQVQIPVEAQLAPNAFVSVYAITGRAEKVNIGAGEVDLGRPTYRIGFANMLVNWGRFKSNVSVKTNKEKYEPGEMVEVAVAVRPEEGQAQASSVTLVALEEKILELKANPTYDVLRALMQMREDSVQTVTALERVETVAMGAQPAPAQTSDDAKGGDEAGDGSSKSEFKRKLFDALVSFQPNVPVVNGVAKFTFKANDSLTRFRVIAISTDAAQKFGMGEAVYLSERETQAYSNIPTVAHTGDNYPLKVTVQNNSAKDAKYKAEITVVIKDRNGKVIGEKKFEKSTTIEKSGSQAIDVGQLDIGDGAASIEYVVRIYDENGKVVDTMEPAPQVVLQSVPLAVHDSLIAQTTGGVLSKSLVKDASAVAGKGEVRVTAAKSLVASAVLQIGQRMERDAFADFLLESRFQKALVRGSEAKPEEMKAVLQAILSSLDGSGFVKSYPQASRGSVYLTASILNSIQQEAWALKLMPAALTEKLKGAVSQVLTKTVEPEYVGKTPMDWMRAQVTMARAAFAFEDEALRGNARTINQSVAEELKKNPLAYGEPVEKWSNSDLVERWLLEVYATPDQALASEFYKQLTSASRLIYTGNLAMLAGAPSYSRFYSDETIETSKFIMGAARVKADKGIAKAVALGLVNANLKGWYNVTSMGHVAQGLKGFGRTYETEVVTGTSLLSVPEMQASTSVDFGQKVSGTLSTVWTKEKATVQVTHAGQGQPWVSIEALSAIPLEKSRGQGLSIEKTIRNVTRESGYQAGDIIEVTLNVNANNAIHAVAMLDPIPAGANILSDAYGDYSTGQKSYSGYKLYFETLNQGMTTVKFQYQLNNPGTFKMPPTRAEGVYAPSVFAEAPNSALKVQ